LKLIFLNRFFFPDHSATSLMLSDLAFALADRGCDVSVITSRQRYDAPAERLAPRETLGGVNVSRIWTSRFGRANLLGRALDYASFYLAAAWRLWRLTRAGDVVIAKTDPPMLSVVAAPICRLRGARLVNWLQDIFPETAEALGVGDSAAGTAYALLRRLRNRSLRAARMNVALGERMAARVAALGVPREHVRIIANWADGALVVPVDHAANALRADWGLAGAFVVGYSGNLGRAHEIGTFLEAMAIVEEAETAQPILWLFIGSGALSAPLQAEAARRQFASVRFKPYQPSELLAQSLSAADVHLVSLRGELEGLIVPSKFYGVCAAGRPTIFVGDRDGEIARLIDRHGCGHAIATGDGAGLARTVLELAADRGRCRGMGGRARQAFEAEFDKPIAIARWLELLAEVSGGRAFPGHEAAAVAAGRAPEPSARNAR
jgi:glycosyltransferase involved in cell wall biosynthesis